MCKLSLLFIEFCLFVILVSLMLDIKRQSVFFFFCLFPNFVYSVIINQSRCTTAFRTQTDTKDMWGDWDGKKRKKRGKERGRWKNGCHRNSKFFLKLPRGERREREREKRIGCVSRLRDNWACACVRAHVRVQRPLFMSHNPKLSAWLTTLLKECTMSKLELADGPIPQRIHRKKKKWLQLTSSMWQIETYYALKLRRAGERLASSGNLGSITECVCVRTCERVWSLQR